MPAPPYTDTIGQIVRITSAATYPLGVTGMQVEETNHFRVCVATGGGDSRAALAGANDTIMQAAMLTLIPSTSRYYGTKVSTVNLHPPPGPRVTVVNAAGTGGAIPTPTQCRGLLSFRSAVGGRTGRARMYLFTPPEGQIDSSGNPGALYIAGLAALGTALLAPIAVGGSTWMAVVAHRPKPPATIWTYDLLTERQAQNFWATQRRSGESGRPNSLPW